MRTAIGIFIALVILAALALAYYYFIYKPANPVNGGNGGNGDVDSAPPASRMTALEVQNVINTYSEKDSLGNPTFHYNGTLLNPDLSRYPIAILQKMLSNGWWFALIFESGSTTSFMKGDNGLYILSFNDLRDTSNPINADHSKVYIPVQLTPYLQI